MGSFGSIKVELRVYTVFVAGQSTKQLMFIGREKDLQIKQFAERAKLRNGSHSRIPCRIIRMVVSITQAELTPLAPSREQTQGGKFFTFFYLLVITAKFSQLKFLLSILFCWLYWSK